MTDAPKIYGALARVMVDVKAVGKDGVNSAQNFRFRGIDGVLNAVGPALRSHGVVVVPIVEDIEISTVEVGKNRSRMAHVTVRVRYRFMAEDGSSVEAVVPAEAFDSGDKAVSKAMSVAFRTALIQSLTLPTNEPDPDSVVYERAPAHDPGPSLPDEPPPPDRFDVLKVKTSALGTPAPVVDWVKAEGITRRKLTDELADEWARRIEEAATPVAVPSGEDPF